MNIVAIIPARMGSSRFPGKPLADIHDMSMVGHVYHRTAMCTLVSDTYVATCDDVIFDHMTDLGGKVVMTADSHERCTDRTAEAMLAIEKQTGKKIDIVIMVQGDEPMVTPQMIEHAVKPLLDNPTHNVVNLMAAMDTFEEFEDPNEVKVVTAPDGRALYFSREPVPSRAKYDGTVPMRKQVCIIPFRRDYLLRFNDLPETELERIESIDMLRILEHGEDVFMVYTDTKTYSVDTAADHKRVVDLMVHDTLRKKYS